MSHCVTTVTIMLAADEQHSNEVADLVSRLTDIAHVARGTQHVRVQIQAIEMMLKPEHFIALTRDPRDHTTRDIPTENPSVPPERVRKAQQRANREQRSIYVIKTGKTWALSVYPSLQQGSAWLQASLRVNPEL
jgi:hypothetical protein